MHVIRDWFRRHWVACAVVALLALVLSTFDPNLLAHSALVTTDMGVTLLFLASIYAFYRYAKKPTWTRLVLTAVAAGLLISRKHSGVLLAPMLVLLILWEVATTAHGQRIRTALKAAITAAKQLSPAARKGYLPNLQSKLSKLPPQAATH